jgi:hypothetical protein
VLQVVRETLDAGGQGVVFGRKVWQSRNPAKMLGALRPLVHDDGTVDEAAELPTTDLSLASCSLALDLHRRRWATDLIREVGLPRAIFPEIRPCGVPPLSSRRASISDRHNPSVDPPD